MFCRKCSSTCSNIVPTLGARPREIPEPTHKANPRRPAAAATPANSLSRKSRTCLTVIVAADGLCIIGIDSGELLLFALVALSGSTVPLTCALDQVACAIQRSIAGVDLLRSMPLSGNDRNGQYQSFALSSDRGAKAGSCTHLPASREWPGPITEPIMEVLERAGVCTLDCPDACSLSVPWRVAASSRCAARMRCLTRKGSSATR